MKKIVIVRHAESPTQPGVSDKERVLSEHGQQQAKLLGINLKCRLDDVDTVICSTAKRTCQTLEGLARAIPKTAHISYEDDMYNASAEAILERIQLAHENARGVMIIAHNPGVSNILQAAAVGEGHNGHAPGSVAYYYSTANTWQGVQFSNMSLKFFLRP